ncbi:uncharacterized protein [Chelonus insularis]|uniref:uncharacterized protein n=1 Tax=Chelonus insularis TaxID=460826 RepID=UPI00158A477F|nr:uncharacterized protein LOC118063787 [Chelonus insularis]XP_034933829.1 uncharacterized protein LOC118063787 [Chelonus insularis]KAG8148361.1 CiV15.8g1-like protein [Chelonus insularis]KAG8148362.1 CiV15.8g1-like protein [Chelonus insularis]
MNNSMKKSKISAKMSRRKSSHLTKLHIHEYAEADSTTSSYSTSSIALIPVSSKFLEFLQHGNIYMKNIRLEYEQMLIRTSLFKPQSLNLRDVIPYEYFLNAILQIDQYHILLSGKSFHYQYLIHHLKKCLLCNRQIGLCISLPSVISSRESLPVSIQHLDSIHGYADADSTTSSWCVVPSVGITLISSDPLKFPQSESVHISNIRHVYDRMLIDISLSEPQLSNSKDLVPYEYFLTAILKTYQYYIQLFGNAFSFHHLISHLKSCSNCNTMIGTCLCGTPK